MKIKNIKYIYVLDNNGKPLMPTKRLGMVRRWLKSDQAHWYKNSRNIIQFNRPTTHHLQKITQGCDLGDHLGISVITSKQEVYSSESHCDGNNTHKRMQERKMYRRTRRNHLRHRAPRFNNRKHAKYAPSIERKLAFQIKEIARISEFLPVNNYIFEGSVFDINKLTHHDDAFVIAGGTNHTTRLGYTIYREKLRCNNRCLEKFYDATYRDLRDNKIKKGAVLSSGRTSRSKALLYNNQRVYRANKIKKGRRTIRKQHHQLRPHDLAMADHKLYCVKGIHNRGTRVILIASPKNISKAISKVNVKYHVNGILVTIK